MAIEEKKVPLEFTFTPSNTTGPEDVVNFDIIYEPNFEQRGNLLKYELEIVNNGVRMPCPIELLTEVIDFLTEKGVIEPKAPTGLLPRIATGSPEAASNIPLPVIDGVDENVVGLNDGTPAPKVVPLTSFDHSRTVDVDAIVDEIVTDNIKRETPTATPTIKVGNKEVVADEIKARPVLRTRAGDTDSEADILKAEREAAEMRGTKPSTFRRGD